MRKNILIGFLSLVGFTCLFWLCVVISEADVGKLFSFGREDPDYTAREESDEHDGYVNYDNYDDYDDYYQSHGYGIEDEEEEWD